jgi:hypothetical protein
MAFLRIKAFACLQYVFFDSVRATAAKQSVAMAGFYIDQQLVAQIKAFTYLLWFLMVTSARSRKSHTFAAPSTGVYLVVSLPT